MWVDIIKDYFRLATGGTALRIAFVCQIHLEVFYFTNRWCVLQIIMRNFSHFYCIVNRIFSPTYVLLQEHKLHPKPPPCIDEIGSLHCFFINEVANNEPASAVALASLLPVNTPNKCKLFRSHYQEVHSYGGTINCRLWDFESHPHLKNIKEFSEHILEILKISSGVLASVQENFKDVLDVYTDKKTFTYSRTERNNSVKLTKEILLHLANYVAGRTCESDHHNRSQKS